MSKKKTYSIDDFLTTSKEEGGQKFQLTLPDGTPTDVCITLYGMASKTMKRAVRDWEADCRKAKKDEDKPDFDTVLAHAIKDWSFPDACNHENAYKLIHGSTTVRKFIDGILGNDRLFFTLGHDASWSPKDSPKDSSDYGSETKTE